VVRWMTAFDTSEDDVDAFVAGIREAAGALSVWGGGSWPGRAAAWFTWNGARP